MLNVIPRFINDKYNDNVMQGDLECSALFIDIAGFTSMTEILMKRGKEGAEDVSELINRIYRPLINSVYREEGFITGFAGDGFTAIFPDSKVENSTLSAFNTARKMQSILQKQHRFRKVIDTELSISARIGISKGSTSWHILGSGQQKAYLFAGNAIVNCADAMNSCKPGDILLDKHALNSLGSEDSDAALTTGGTSAPDRLSRVKRSIVSKFVPDEVIQYPLTGEFRDVASVFTEITLTNGIEELDEFITASLGYAGFYGSYCNGLFLDEKGLHMLTVFGAPVGYEDNVRRAVNFAIAIRNDFKGSVSTGITYGTAYAGLVGSRKRGTYTVLGKAVNLTAQLMQHSGPGEILMTGKAVEYIAKHFILSEQREISFKGKAEPVRSYNVEKKQSRTGKRIFENKLFGRLDELEQLQVNCEVIFKGAFAGITYVYGDAGIGKSRIVSELLEKSKDRFISIVLQCDSIHRNSFHPFIYGLKNYFHQSEQNSREQNNQYFEDNFRMLIKTLKLISDERKDDILSELTRTKSFTAALLGHFQEDSLYSQLKPQARHTNTIAAIKVFLKALSLIKPLIIVQEDLHWIDEDSQKAYQVIVLNISDYPIAIIAVGRYRDDSSRPALNTPETIPAHVIALKRISEYAIKRLINDRMQNPASNKLLRTIIDHTEGNPFYIEQLCIYLLENNLIGISNQECILIDSSFGIPEGIRSIIVARLDRLTRSLRELVQNASILGREFDITVLSLMLRSGCIDDLIIEGESKAIWSALSEMLYIFKHAMLQSVAYDMQLRKRQRELHETAGESLEQLYAEDKTRYIEIAYHFEKAENTSKTVEYLQKAYEYSSSEYKLVESRELLERLVKYPASEKDAGKCYSDLAYTCFALGDWDSSQKYYKICFRLYDAACMYREKAICQAHHACNTVFTSNLNVVNQLVNEALIYGEKEDDSEVILPALSALGLLEQSRSKYDKAIEYFEQVLDHAKITGKPYDVTYAISNLSSCYMMVGQNENAIKLMKEGLALAEDINKLMFVAQYHINLGQTYMFMKKYSSARVHFDRALPVAKKIGILYVIAKALGGSGSLYFYLGDYARSLEYLTKAVEICEESDNSVLLVTSLCNLAEANVCIANYTAAEKQITRALGYARDRNDILNEGILLCLKARILYETGDHKAGTEFNDKALPMIESMQWRDGVFQSMLLKAKLISVNDEEVAKTYLLSMAEEYKEPEYTGYINYELYRIDGGDGYRMIALKEFTELYENEGQSRTYKGLIDELKKQEVL